MILSVGSNQCWVKTKLLSFLLFTKTISIKKKKNPFTMRFYPLGLALAT